jgi:2'-hydroxyisoflavone reductase
MKILVLGGTVFLGRYLVESALAGDHEVTLFNRGRQHPELFPHVEKLRGEREGGLEALRGRHWDAVIDTSGYLPWVVKASAELLSDAVEQYTFISSISIYAKYFPGMDEGAETSTLTEEQSKEAEKIATGENTTAASYGALYGPLKAACEKVAECAMPGRVLNVRSGLLVGPHDYSDRFTYWVHRVAQGGEVLAPGRPERLLQFVDVRDLADWIVRMIERKQTGVFNANGPDQAVTMGDLLETSKRLSNSDARFTWVSDSFLLESGGTPWTELPLWVPEDWGTLKHVNFDKALAAGLTFRALSETVRDTLAWSATRSDTVLRAGLTPAREQQFLKGWAARNKEV